MPIGLYGKGRTETGNVEPQTADVTIAEQIAIPHGNSLLAPGSYDNPVAGAPVIPDAASPLPSPAGLSTTPYTESLNTDDNYRNSQPDHAANCNLLLQTATGIIKPDSFVQEQRKRCKVRSVFDSHGHNQINKTQQRRNNEIPISRS